MAFILKGRDSNHPELPAVRVCKAWLLVGPDYHALHHMHPTHFHGSWTKLIDYFAGTAATPVSAQASKKNHPATGGEHTWRSRAHERDHASHTYYTSFPFPPHDSSQASKARG